LQSSALLLALLARRRSPSKGQSERASEPETARNLNRNKRHEWLAIWLTTGKPQRIENDNIPARSTRPVARRSNNARRGNLFVSVFIPRFFLVEMLFSSMLIALYSLFRRDFGVIRLVDAADC
jgi:hypothetical protein